MAASAEHRIIYGDHPDQFVELWEPAGEPCGSIVLIHGGYWRQRYDLDSTRRIAAHTSSAGWKVLNIEYRRVDDTFGVWPGMAADVLRSARFADRHPRVVIGHSAGGHLALWLAAQPGYADAVIALAPLADLVKASELALSDSATTELFGGSATELPDLYASASPIELVPLGLPTVVVHGGADESVPKLLADNYVRSARESGDDVEYIEPAAADHMDVIDPEHPVWRDLDSVLAGWTELG